jgi:hypothetical protein
MNGAVTSTPICLHVVDADKCTFIVKEDVKRILGWSTRCLQLSL